MERKDREKPEFELKLVRHSHWEINLERSKKFWKHLISVIVITINLSYKKDITTRPVYRVAAQLKIGPAGHVNYFLIYCLVKVVLYMQLRMFVLDMLQLHRHLLLPANTISLSAV